MFAWLSARLAGEVRLRASGAADLAADYVTVFGVAGPAMATVPAEQYLHDWKGYQNAGSAPQI